MVPKRDISCYFLQLTVTFQEMDLRKLEWSVILLLFFQYHPPSLGLGEGNTSNFNVDYKYIFLRILVGWLTQTLCVVLAVLWTSLALNSYLPAFA